MSVLTCWKIILSSHLRRAGEEGAFSRTRSEAVGRKLCQSNLFKLKSLFKYEENVTYHVERRLMSTNVLDGQGMEVDLQDLIAYRKKSFSAAKDSRSCDLPYRARRELPCISRDTLRTAGRP